MKISRSADAAFIRGPEKARKHAGFFAMALFSFSALIPLSLAAPGAEATCNGCVAHWGIFGSGGSQHGERQNYSSESISQQEYHFAFSSCDKQTYYGDPYNYFTYYGIGTSPRNSSVNQSGGVFFSGAHNWTNGGDYSVSPADTSRGC